LILPGFEVDPIGAAASWTPRITVDVGSGNVDHFAAARRIVKFELLGRRVKDNDAPLGLISDIEPSLLVRSHHRAGACRLERLFPGPVRPSPYFDFARLRIQPADRVVIKVIEPDRPIRTDPRVVWPHRDWQFPRGVDDLSFFSFGSWQRLQIIFPRAVGEIDCSNGFGLPAIRG